MPDLLEITFYVFWLQCHLCNAKSPRSKTVEESETLAKKAGFVLTKRRVYCPQCAAQPGFAPDAASAVKPSGEA